MTSSSSSGADSRVRVCLVEGNATVRELLSAVLIDAGFELAATATLREGLDAITLLVPRVAVIAHHLPDGRGIDLCQVVADRCPAVHAILHASALSPQEHREALEAGATAVVFQSIHNGALLDAITEHGRMPRRLGGW